MFCLGDLAWNSPKSLPTIGSSQTLAPSISAIMLRSHVLPLRPEPKIQTMFAGFTPPPRAPPSPASFDRNRPSSR